jgi:drug/metabolite transporter superfamily protein YnfA
MNRTQSGAVMQIVGVVMIVAAAIWLFVVDEPFPMWLILAGGGVMFLGVGAAVRRDSE